MKFNSKFLILLLNKMNKNTLMEHLSITFVHIDGKYLIAKMPISSSVHQPFGLLHGGASVVLAETVGSAFSILHIKNNIFQVLGVHISANHVKSIKKGILYAKASFLKKTNFKHIIKIKLYDEYNELISFALLTNIIFKKKIC